MGFTSDACWVFFLKSLLIKNNNKREAALKNEAGGDEKHVFFFYLALLKHLQVSFFCVLIKLKFIKIIAQFLLCLVNKRVSM